MKPTARLRAGALACGAALLLMLVGCGRREQGQPPRPVSLPPPGVPLAPAQPLTESQFPDWLCERTAQLPWDGHQRERVLTRKTLETSLALGRTFLLNNQKPAGNFNYQYNWVTGERDPADNQVRQAGALWGIALLHRYQPLPETRAALEKGIQFFLDHSQPGAAAETLVVAYPGDSRCETGCVALVALSLIEYLRLDPAASQAPAPERRKELVTALTGYLNHLVAAQLPTGGFSQRLQLRDKSWDSGSNPYADGESLLCLVKAAKYLGRDDLIPALETAATKLAKHYTVDQWRTKQDSALTKGFFQWSCMALSEYAEAGWAQAELYRDYVLTLGWWMIHIHETLGRTRNTAYAYEGLIPAYVIARDRGHQAAAAELESVIDRGLRKLTTWQVGGPLQTENLFLTAHPTEDPLAVGGVMNHAAEAPLRIDVTQHQMHAVMMALTHVYPPGSTTD